MNDFVSLKYNKILDYIALTKFRLLMMVLITAAIGYYVASIGPINFWLMSHLIIGTGLIGAGANSLNQYYEREADQKMERTKNRPLPAQRLTPNEAKIFGLIITLLGVVELYIWANPLTAQLGIFSWAFYLFLYTPLKQKTILNTWVGAVPGAIPPVMGWTAARGTLDTESLSLFAILYFWQLPHFFAISWMCQEDYRRGGFRMLSFDDNDGRLTSKQMLINVILLLFVSISPYLSKQFGDYYLYSAILLGSMYLLSVFSFIGHRDRNSARLVFFASIIYLPLLLIMMVFDKTIIK